MSLSAIDLNLKMRLIQDGDQKVARISMYRADEPDYVAAILAVGDPKTTAEDAYNSAVFRLHLIFQAAAKDRAVTEKTHPGNTVLPMIFTPAPGIITLNSGSDTIDLNYDQAEDLGTRLLSYAKELKACPLPSESA